MALSNEVGVELERINIHTLLTVGNTSKIGPHVGPSSRWQSARTRHKQDAHSNLICKYCHKRSRVVTCVVRAGEERGVKETDSQLQESDSSQWVKILRLALASEGGE